MLNLEINNTTRGSDEKSTVVTLRYRMNVTLHNN